MSDMNLPERPLVYLVDDDRALRDSLVYVLEKAGLECVAFSSPSEFLETSIGNGPGCVILDLSMPDVSGMELYRLLLKKGFPKPVMFLTACGSVPSAVEAMRLGAVEYLEKPVGHEFLVDRVRHAIHRDIENERIHREARDLKSRIQTLTTREQEILNLIQEGLLSKQIASKLDISIKTVEVHRSNLSKKLGVSSAANLVRLFGRLK